MPGFIIGDTKEDTKASSINMNVTNSEYYTNFFWDVKKVLGDVISLNNKAPLLALVDCKLPTFTVEEEKGMGGSIDYKFAKKVNYEDVSMVWYDNVGLLPIMLDWMKSIFTPESGIAFANDYKKDTEIHAFTSDGSKRQVHTLIQSWPKSIKFSDLSYTSSDIKKVDMTLSYDFAKYDER